MKHRTPQTIRKRRQSSSSWQPLALFVSALVIAVAIGAPYLSEAYQSGKASVAAAAAAAAAAEVERPLVGALQQNVYERGLVVRQTGAKSVLRESGAFYFNVTRRVSPGRVLGFVSPWSTRGEEMAWRFASKLTHLSPIMYMVDNRGQIIAHERESWLDTLREGLACPSCPPPARLVPHVSLAGLNMSAMFGGDDSNEQAGRLLVALLHTAAERHLDGFVLDAHSHLAPLYERLAAPRRPLLQLTCLASLPRASQGTRAPAQVRGRAASLRAASRCAALGAGRGAHSSRAAAS